MEATIGSPTPPLVLVSYADTMARDLLAYRGLFVAGHLGLFFESLPV